ncbi:MAG: AgmX/PglI C-terminal domain-containing protein, partial [Pseudomonadota bacterium]
VLFTGTAAGVFLWLRNSEGKKVPAITLGLPRQVGGPSFLEKSKGVTEPKKKNLWSKNRRQMSLRPVMTNKKIVTLDGGADFSVIGPNRVAILEPHGTSEPLDSGQVVGVDTSIADGVLAQSEAEDIEREKATLDAESIQMVIQHHLPRIRVCHDRATKNGTAVMGAVDIRIVIGSDGRVQSSLVDRNTTGHFGLGQCIANLIQQWRFPRPLSGEAIFIYPFNFSSHGKQEGEQK